MGRKKIVDMSATMMREGMVGRGGGGDVLTLDLFEGGRNLPELDFHGLRFEDFGRVELDIKEFLIESANKGERVARVVHGIGTGKVKAEVVRALTKLRQEGDLVEDFKSDDKANGGSCLVKVRL